MAVRKLKPTTPGQRHKVIGTFDTLLQAPEKSLVGGATRKSGGGTKVR